MGQKQNRSSYMAREVLHPIFGCPWKSAVKPADFEFPQEKVLRSAKQQVGVISLEGQLSSAIHLRTYIYARPFIAMASARVPHRSAPRTNSHSCNQTRLDSGDFREQRD